MTLSHEQLSPQDMPWPWSTFHRAGCCGHASSVSEGILGARHLGPCPSCKQNTHQSLLARPHVRHELTKDGLWPISCLLGCEQQRPKVGAGEGAAGHGEEPWEGRTLLDFRVHTEPKNLLGSSVLQGGSRVTDPIRASLLLHRHPRGPRDVLASTPHPHRRWEGRIQIPVATEHNWRFLPLTWGHSKSPPPYCLAVPTSESGYLDSQPHSQGLSKKLEKRHQSRYPSVPQGLLTLSSLP